MKAEVVIRSYEVETQDGRVLRRNRSHLRKTTEDEDEADETIFFKFCHLAYSPIKLTLVAFPCCS